MSLCIVVVLYMRKTVRPGAPALEVGPGRPLGYAILPLAQASCCCSKQRTCIKRSPLFRRLHLRYWTSHLPDTVPTYQLYASLSFIGNTHVPACKTTSDNQYHVQKNTEICSVPSNDDADDATSDMHLPPPESARRGFESGGLRSNETQWQRAKSAEHVSFIKPGAHHFHCVKCGQVLKHVYLV